MVMPTLLLILAKVSSSSDKPIKIVKSVKGIAIKAAAVRIISVI